MANSEYESEENLQEMIDAQIQEIPAQGWKDFLGDEYKDIDTPNSLSYEAASEMILDAEIHEKSGGFVDSYFLLRDVLEKCSDLPENLESRAVRHSVLSCASVFLQMTDTQENRYEKSYQNISDDEKLLWAKETYSLFDIYTQMESRHSPENLALTNITVAKVRKNHVYIIQDYEKKRELLVTSYEDLTRIKDQGVLETHNQFNVCNELRKTVNSLCVIEFENGNDAQGATWLQKWKQLSEETNSYMEQQPSERRIHQLLSIIRANHDITKYMEDRDEQKKYLILSFTQLQEVLESGMDVKEPEYRLHFAIYLAIELDKLEQREFDELDQDTFMELPQDDKVRWLKKAYRLQTWSMSIDESQKNTKNFRYIQKLNATQNTSSRIAFRMKEPEEKFNWSERTYALQKKIIIGLEEQGETDTRLYTNSLNNIIRTTLTMKSLAGGGNDAIFLPIVYDYQKKLMSVDKKINEKLKQSAMTNAITMAQLTEKDVPKHLHWLKEVYFVKKKYIETVSIPRKKNYREELISITDTITEIISLVQTEEELTYWQTEKAQLGLP